jgi:hypothetical protein
MTGRELLKWGTPAADAVGLAWRPAVVANNAFCEYNRNVVDDEEQVQPLAPHQTL